MKQKIIHITLLLIISITVHSQTWTQKENEFYSLLKIKNNKLAKNKALEILNWANQNFSDTSINIAYSYRLLGDAYYSENVDSALYYYSTCVKTLKKQKRQNTILAAKALYNSANLYVQKKDYDRYYSTLNESAKIIRGLQYPEFPFSEVVMEQLYHFQIANKEYEIAEDLLKECVFIFNKYSKQNTEQCASVLQSLGTYYFTQERYSEAEKYIVASIESYKKSIGEENLFCSGNYLWLGEIYDRNEDYISAEKCYFKSLEIYNNILPRLDNKEKELYYYPTLEAFAQFYWGLGIYDKSQEVYNKLRNICVANNDTLRLISLIVPMSISYIDNKNFDSANKFLIDQLKYFPKITKENINDYLPVLSCLIITNSSLRSTHSTELFITERLNLSKRYFGEISEEYLMALNDECEYYIDINEINKATKKIDECLTLSRKIHKNDIKGFTQTIDNYAEYYNQTGYYQKSIDLYQAYFKNIESLNLPKDKVYNYNLFDYAMVLQNSGDYVLAFNVIEKICDSKRDYISKNIFYLNRNEREIVWNKEQKYFNIAINFASKASSEVNGSIELAYNNSLISKALLIESSLDFNKTISNSKDTAMLVVYQELNVLRTYSAKITSEGEKNQNYLSQLEHQADSLDQLLSRKLSSYADYKKNFYLTWKDVQSNLSNSEASIEFARYYGEKDSAYHYLALIVKQGDKHPSLIKLCSEDELKRFSPEKELNELYTLLWKPIYSQLTGIKTIYYTPAGLMNNIPLQALYEDKEEGREYLMDKYSLNQLTSTRYLALGLKKKAQEPIETNIALFGGVNYNDYPETKSDTSNYVASEAAFLYKNLIASRDLNDTRSGASYLPGTKKEVENIADLLNSNKWEVTTTEGKNASENKFKAFSGTNSKSILHIATHGFAFPDKEESKRKELFRIENGNEKYKVSDNPMIRCGLLFSGANMTWQGKGDSLLKTTNEDAVLTAYELSQLDLSNTKLVVLSACETGKGAIQGSEGTFGLKRALKLAGVDNMIVSLWKVPDDATMEMMTLFYTELAKTKLPVSAFETAQKAMRNKYLSEPQKWAGFVFVR